MLIITLWMMPITLLADDCETNQSVNGLSKYISGRVDHIDRGDLVFENGQVITLPGIWHPESGPITSQIREKKRDLIGQDLAIYVSDQTIDRYGRVPGFPKINDQWWHIGILCNGLGVPDGTIHTPAFLMAERSARQNKLGLWTDAFFVHPADDYVNRRPGYFAILSGRIREVAKVRDTIYLNFGNDWKTDTTAAITGDAIDRITDTHGDIMALTGRWVEVRGILQLYNGPYIQLTHPGQLRNIPPEK